MGHSNQALTRNQAAVLDVLKRRHKPMGAYAILAELRDSGIAHPPTVYRALDQLIELRLIHKIESLNAFVTCSHADHHHIHPVALLVCKDCGQVEEIEMEQDFVSVKRHIAQKGFSMDHALIELVGHCGPCQSNSGQV
jgi:Fur family transcriptional regulator, zinc uptake regulator